MTHHDTVILVHKNGSIVFAQSFDNSTQREEMMKRLAEVQEDYGSGWEIGPIEDLSYSNELDLESIDD